MKHSITPEEHARVQRRRGRQALGLLVAILVVVGFVTVLRAGVGAVANLFDDTAQKQEYEDKLEGLVLFDPMPFDGIENIDDLTLREAAVWGCIYSIQETQGGFDNYNTDSWYLTGLTESETKAESTDSTSAASLPEPMAESDVQDAILATAGSDAADSAASAVEPETQAENGADSAVAEAPAADDAASTAG